MPNCLCEVPKLTVMYCKPQIRYSFDFIQLLRYVKNVCADDTNSTAEELILPGMRHLEPASLLKFIEMRGDPENTKLENGKTVPGTHKTILYN